MFISITVVYIYFTLNTACACFYFILLLFFIGHLPANNFLGVYVAVQSICQ